MTKKNKRELVLRIREAKRRAAKAERSLAYENAKAFAAANPTPKLPQHIRIRPRDERQILDADDTGILPTKTASRLGILDQNGVVDPYQLNHWVKAITESQKIRSDRNQAFTLSWQLQVAKNNAPAESELELEVL